MRGINLKRWISHKSLRYIPNKGELEDIMLQRGFVIPSFEIYGGVAGLYDLGPLGCSLMNNITQTWKRNLVVPDDISEISSTIVTPRNAFKASGHCEKFTDLMVADILSGECFRADKLIEEQLQLRLSSESDPTNISKFNIILRNVGEMVSNEIDHTIREYDIRSPSGGELGSSFPFNLMFQTEIGPSGKSIGFLRPETAQGMFSNFKRLLELNSGKLPFGVSQIGTVFRNEISPRSGLLRLREFSLAEIEYFYDPEVSLNNLDTLEDIPLPLVTSDSGIVHLSLSEIVSSKLVSNPLLLYFMVRSWTFLCEIGVDMSKARFRRHQEGELAHYAEDCWDIELETSKGWIECVGIADRTCYDLSAHSRASGTDMSARRELCPPKVVRNTRAIVNKALVGREFRERAKEVMEGLENVQEDWIVEYREKGGFHLGLRDGESVWINKEHVSFEEREEIISNERFFPSVIEPSFGLHRIMFALMEHSFYCREEDDKRKVLTFNPTISPIQIMVLSLSNKPELLELSEKIYQILKQSNEFRVKCDNSSASIGKRYSRADEIGAPFALTVDFDSLEDNSVTIRERDSSKQQRIPTNQILDYLRKAVQTK